MNKKGFTIIELLTVIAILGILVLLAAPRFLGYSEHARLAQIKNDIKVHETFIDSKLILDSKFTESWDEISKSDLESFKNENSIYDKRGLLKSNHQFDSEKYLIIPKKSKGVNVNTKLPGKFILDPDGDVYYQGAGGINKKPSPDTDIPIADVGCFNWEEAESSATVVGYICEDENVSIPAEYNGKPVTDIGMMAFMHLGDFPEEDREMFPPGAGATKAKIKKVVIPDSVINIQDLAFAGGLVNNEPHLESVELGGNVQTIGLMAFIINKIKSLKIPDSVVDIAEEAFAGSFYLEDLQIGSGLTEIKENVFFSAVSLNKIIIPGNIKEIHSGSFANSAVNDITLEEGVEIIRSGAFAGASSFIASRSYCKYLLPSEGKTDSDCNNVDNFWDATDPALIKIWNKKGLKFGNLNLPKSMIKTGEKNIFYDMKFNEVNIENAEALTKNELYGIEAKTVNIYNDLNKINEESFYYTFIDELVIHGNVNHIEYGAFNDSELKRLELKGNVDIIGGYAFSNNNFVNGIKFEGSVNEIQFEAFNSSSISNVTLPEDLTIIEDGAFSENNISSLSIPDSVSIIGAEAFSKNPLNSVSFGIGTGIQTIWSSAFERFDGGSVQVTAPMSKESIIINNNSYINFVQLP